MSQTGPTFMDSALAATVHRPQAAAVHPQRSASRITARHDNSAVVRLDPGQAHQRNGAIR
jgi:hypothetical protein